MKLHSAVVLCFTVISELIGAVVINKCTKPGLLAMTFDEGPSVQYTGQLLDLLFSKKVRVNFHFITEYAADPAVVALMKRAANEGHLVGLRGENAFNWNTTEAPNVKTEVETRAQILENITGKAIKFVRFPYKQYNQTIVVPAVESLGYIVTEHNLDSYDYQNADVLQSFKNYLEPSSNKTDSFISIQKDNIPGTASFTDKVIDYVISKGYKLVLLDECLGMASSTTSSTSTKTSSSTINTPKTSSIQTTKTSVTAASTTSTTTADPTNDARTLPDVGNAASSIFSQQNFAFAAVSFVFGILFAWF